MFMIVETIFPLPPGPRGSLRVHFAFEFKKCSIFDEFENDRNFKLNWSQSSIQGKIVATRSVKMVLNIITNKNRQEITVDLISDMVTGVCNLPVKSSDISKSLLSDDFLTLTANDCWKMVKSVWSFFVGAKNTVFIQIRTKLRYI